MLFRSGTKFPDGCVFAFESIVPQSRFCGGRDNHPHSNQPGNNRSYFEALEVKAEKMAKKYDCAFVDNEMPYGRVPQGHPVIVDYFYHEEIRGTENTGKRNR